jgi:PAS domain S-box-containing protein
LDKKRFLYSLPLILLLIVVIAGWFATDYLGNKARQDIISESQASVLTLSTYVSSTFTTIEGAVKSLAGSPWIVPALLSKRDQDIENANSALDRYNSALNASVSYLMDTNGMTVASSNRNDPDSFEGISYRFRPYFQEAAKGKPYHYFAMGITSRKRGFYASYPVQNSLGKVIGVVTMKKDIDDMATFFRKYPFCFFISPEGIIFLSSKSEMVLKSLWPLDKTVQQKLIASEQFGSKLSDAVTQKEMADGTEATLKGKNYFVSRKVIDSGGWSIVLLTSTDRIWVYKLTGFLTTIFVCFLIIVFSGILYLTDRSREAIRRSEEKFRTLAESSSFAILMHQGDYFIYANREAEEISGYTEAELCGVHFWDFVHPDYRNLGKQIGLDRQQGKVVPHVYELKIITKNGMEKWVSLTGNPIKYEGKPTALISVMDITERKRAEEELRKSEENFRLSLDDSPLGVRIVTVEGETLYANQATLKIYGYDRIEELKRTPIKERYTPESYAELKTRKEKRERGEVGPSEYEISIVRKNGDVRHVQVFRKEVWWNGARQFQIIYYDITEHRQMEEVLKESEKKYRLLADNVHDVIFVLDMNLNHTYVSPSVKIQRGYEPEEVLQQRFTDTLTPASTDLVMKNLSEIMELEKSEHRDINIFRTLELEMRRKDRTTIWIEVKTSFIRDENQRAVGIMGVTRDITDRKQIETALRVSEERFSKVFQASPAPTYISTISEGRYIDVNNSGMQLLGYTREEMIGHTVRELGIWHTFSERKLIVQKLIAQGSIHDEPVLLRTKNGEAKETLLSCEIIRLNDEEVMLSLVYDITELRQAEDTLRKSDILFKKLSSWVPGMIYQFMKRPDGTYCTPFTTEAIKNVFGCSPQDVREDFSPIARVILPEDFDKVISSIEDSAKYLTIWTCEYRVQIPGQSIKWILGNSTPEKLADGGIIWHGFITDVTERKQAEEELRTSHLQLRALAKRLQQIREEDRIAIAREVHDEMGGGLTGLKMDLSWLLRKIGDADSSEERVALMDKIHTSNALIDQMIHMVRRVSTHLRPSILDDLGLIAALEWQLSEFTSRTEIPHEFTTTFEYVNMEEDTTIAVFRIFQEALTNVARHSQATKVAVVLREGERSLFGEESFVLEIRDNGRGITEEKILNPESLGLLGMKERVLAFGGELSIHGEPGGGTAMVLQIPRKQGEES